MAKNRKKKKTNSYKVKSNSLFQFQKRLYAGKFDPKSVFRDLHAFRDFKEMSAAAKYVSNPNNPYHRFIFGIPFAKSYSDLYSTNFSVFTNNLQRDLDWMSLSIVRYAKEISSFVRKKISFEKAFLLGSYERAKNILDSINAEFGPSLWGLEKGFLLAEYTSGLEANKKLLAGIVGDETNDAILSVMAEYVSLRCEFRLSVDNYRRRLHRFLDDFDEDDLSEIFSYFRYRLEPLDIDLLPIASIVTVFETSIPIVDRYLTFITIVQLCAAVGSEFFDIAANVMSRLDGLIQDSRVDALLQYFVPGREQKWGSLSNELLRILDNYTDGHYKMSASESATLLAENPDIFDLYYIYIRSQDYLEEPFKQVFPKDSLAAFILEHSNEVIRGKKSWRDSSSNILKVAMSLWRDPLAYGLYDFYAKEVSPSPEKKFNKLALLNTLQFNPRFATIYEDPEKANKFLEQLSHQAGESCTLSLTRVLTTSSHNDENFKFPPSIPETRRRVYSGAIHEAAGRYQRAISVLKPLLTSIEEDKLSGGFHTRDRVTKALFRCYLEIKELPECTDMVVSSFLRNELSTRKLPLNLLVKAIDETSPQDVMRSISYPILYSIVHTKARAVYVAYDNFMSKLGVSKPTQLFAIADQYSSVELHEFLFKVCTIDVLSCSYHFEGTKDLETERIRICQFLSERDPKI